MGENTLQGGHFGHFHDMYVKYISAKCIGFNFGFDILIFTNLMISFFKIKNLNLRNNEYIYQYNIIKPISIFGLTSFGFELINQAMFEMKI